MTTSQLQKKLNAFDKRFRLKHKKLVVDGQEGAATRRAIRRTKYYMGYPDYRKTEFGLEFLWRLNFPRTKSKQYNITRAELKRGTTRRKMRRAALHSTGWSWAWGGSRGVTNDVIRLLGGKYAITSRKRWETFGNPSSDHYMLNKTADAVDFATANNWAEARRIYAHLTGHPERLWPGDFKPFFIARKGKLFRIQIIAVTHGTGPHLHVGVKRV